MSTSLRWILFLIYLMGIAAFNQAVSDACTHGNCIHGWYSKYNRPEQALALTWILGLPLVVVAVSSRVRQSNGGRTRASQRTRLAASKDAEAARLRDERMRHDELVREQRDMAGRVARRSPVWRTHFQELKRSRTRATARKAWRCEACGLAFEVGTDYFHAGYSGGSSRTKYCSACVDESSG